MCPKYTFHLQWVFRNFLPSWSSLLLLFSFSITWLIWNCQDSILSIYTPRNLVLLTSSICHPSTLTRKSSPSSQNFIATVFPMFSDSLLALTKIVVNVNLYLSYIVDNAWFCDYWRWWYHQRRVSHCYTGVVSVSHSQI